MRRLLLAFLVSVFVFNLTAFADVPSTMSYQGRLTDGFGNPVADDSYDVVFRIYGVSAGGTALWNSGTVPVTTADGIFSYELGSSTPLPSGLFSDSADLWLGITVESETEISPRTKLTSHSWAFHSATTDSLIAGPGVVQELMEDEGNVTLLNGFSVVIAEDTILAPDSGYVVIQASVNMSCVKAGTTSAGCNVELRDSTLTHLVDQEFFWTLPTAIPAGLHVNAMHIHRVFRVRPGINRFSLIGSDFLEAGSTFTAGPYVMSMTFVPYNYGTVEFSRAPALSDSKPKLAPLTFEELKLLRIRAGSAGKLE